MVPGKLKNILVTLTILSGVIGIIYLSKPDRGGLNRCQEIFGLDSLSPRGLEKLPLSRWSPFENSKFRMKIQKGKFEDFKSYLYHNGYKVWEQGGLEYGSLHIGCDGSDPIEYSFKKFRGHVHIIAHDKKNNLVYLIVSQ